MPIVRADAPTWSAAWVQHGAILSRRASRLAAALLFFQVVFVAGAPLANAQLSPPDASPWVVDNGGVQAIANSGGLTYIGGGFHYVGPRTGAAVAFSVSGGQRLTSFPEVDLVGSAQDAADPSGYTGSVDAVISDGGGGWYLGGGFTSVGGVPRNGLAHVLSDGSVDPGFHPDPNGSVWALALAGSKLYVGGSFTVIGGAARISLAAVDASSGQVGSWDPGLGAHALVDTLAVVGGRLYAGGYWSTVNGGSRPNAVAYDLASGSETAWSPAPSAQVYALTSGNGVIYAGGLFTTIGGQTRDGIAALDPSSGAATSWEPSGPNNGGNLRSVNALAVDGTTVWAGGNFRYIGGATHYNLAALNAADGTARPLSVDTDDLVNSLAVAGGRVYVGGHFTWLAGAARGHLGSFDAATGAVSAWDPELNGPPLPIAADAQTVYAVGTFSSAGMVERDGLAALDASGVPTSWNPGTSGFVNALLPSADGASIYVGGSFGELAGTARANLGAVATSDGSATSFDPEATDGQVESLALSGSRLYVTGTFDAVGGQARAGAGAVDASSGAPLAWDPHLAQAQDNTGRVLDVRRVAVAGSRVYVGGDFTSAGGQPREAVAAVDPTTGALQSWDAQLSHGARVFDVVPVGATVYVAGAFSAAGGQARSNLAALDATSGRATAWAPNPDDLVARLLLDPSGQELYVLGAFEEISGMPRDSIGAIRTADAAPTDFAPSMLVRSSVGDLAFGGSALDVGWPSPSVDLQARAGFARFTSPSTQAATVPQFTLGLTVPQATTPSPAVISVAGDAPLVADLAVWTQPDSSAGCATTLEAEGARSGATFAMEQGVLGAYHQSQAIAAADGTRLICAYLERPFTYTPLARAQGRVTLGPAPQPSPGTGTGAGGSGSSGSTVSTSSTPPQPSSPGAGQTTGANSAQPVTEAAAPSPSTGTVPDAAMTGSSLGTAPARQRRPVGSRLVCHARALKEARGRFTPLLTCTAPMAGTLAFVVRGRGVERLTAPMPAGRHTVVVRLPPLPAGHYQLTIVLDRGHHPVRRTRTQLDLQSAHRRR